MTRELALWTGVLAGPIVWLFSFEAKFALVPWACIFQAKLALHIVSLLALALAAGSGLLAWRQWNELGRELPGEGGGALPRSRIMAVGGVLLSSLFFLVILAQAIPEVLLGVCE
ncbi:MAG: hypothetical protein ACJ74Z_23320 [Bryobacteraceae bacterium]